MAATIASAPPVAASGAGSAAAAGAAPGTAIPPSAATLWVGDLSTNPEVTAQELFEEFSAVASVASLRLCRDRDTKASRGYAYVNFSSVEEASKAMQALNYTEFRGKPCRIMWASKDRTARLNNSANICIKDLGDSVDPKSLVDMLTLYGNVLSCKVPRRDGKSVGFAFVSFESKESAAEAISDLNGSTIEGHQVKVEWYKSKEERAALQSWTNMYIKQFPRSWTAEDMRTLLSKHGAVTSLHFPTSDDGKSVGFCHANFGSTEEAKAALAAINGMEVENPDHVPGDDSTPASGGPPTLTIRASRAMKKQQRQAAMAADYARKKREFLQTVDGRNLYVKNLDERVDEEELKRFFAKFGTVESVRIKRDDAGNSMLFGFVLMATAEEAQRAQAAANRAMLLGKPLYVALWQSKARRAAMLAASRRSAFPGGPMGPGGFPGGMEGGVPGGVPGYGFPMGFRPGMNPMAFAGMRGAGMVPAGYPMPPHAQQQAQQQAMGRMGVPPQHMQGAAGMAPIAATGAGGHPGMHPAAAAAARAAAAAAGSGQPGGQMPQGGPAGTPAGHPHAGHQMQQQPPAQAQQPAQQPPAAATAGSSATAPSAASQTAGGPSGASAQPSGAAAAGAGSELPSVSALIAMDPSKRHNVIGRRLFPLVKQLAGGRAPKITGMLLEGMEVSDLLGLLQSPTELQQNVERCNAMLDSEAGASA